MILTCHGTKISLYCPNWECLKDHENQSRQTDRQTDRQAGRQTDRQKDRHKTDQTTVDLTNIISFCFSRFNDRLTITFVFGVSHTIQLSAHGEGTTISCSPPIIPAIDFGPHFSTGPCVQRFTLKNEGRRMQALSWTTQGYSTIKAKKLLQQTKSGSKMNISRPVFQIIPNRFVLDPQEEIDVEIMGHSDQSCDVTETLVCHAIIGKNPMKEKIMETTISAHFISPVLQFSRETLHFGVVQVCCHFLLYFSTI